MAPHLILLSGIYTIDSVSFTRPIACYQLKHWLSHFGIRVQVIEFCALLTSQEIQKAIDKFVGHETLAVGFSTSFWRQGLPAHLISVIDHVRSVWPTLKVIAGGARTPQESALFDQVFRGDSEDSLVVWCQEQMGRKGRSLFNRKFNITELAHRFDHTDCIMPGEALPIELGRGCVFKCKFCSHQNLGKAKHTYQRQHKLIVEEMQHNKQQFGVTQYLFLDDTVNEDQDKVERLAHLTEDLGFEIEWVGYLRADLLWSKKNQPQQLRASGMRSCLFGIETFNLEAGRSIDKSWAARHGKDYLPRLYNEIWDRKVNIYTSLIAGLPGETYESLRQTVDWCLEQDMGYTRINALALYVSYQDEYTQSEFTKNYADYGYTNVNVDGYWETPYVTATGCRDFCNQANKELNKQNRVSCWGLFGMTNLTSKSIDEVMTWRSYTVPLRIKQGLKTFTSDYLSRLHSLPV